MPFKCLGIVRRSSYILSPSLLLYPTHVYVYPISDQSSGKYLEKESLEETAPE